MCDKRIMALKQQLIKPTRPVQTVTPEPVKPLQSLPQTVKPSRVLKKANTMPKVILSFLHIVVFEQKFPNMYMDMLTTSI